MFHRNKEMQRSHSKKSLLVFRAYPSIFFFDKSNIHIGPRKLSLRKT